MARLTLTLASGKEEKLFLIPEIPLQLGRNPSFYRYRADGMNGDIEVFIRGQHAYVKGGEGTLVNGEPFQGSAILTPEDIIYPAGGAPQDSWTFKTDFGEWASSCLVGNGGMILPIPLSGPLILQNRKPSLFVHLVKDHHMSKQHLEFLLHDDKVQVKDLGSTNGSFLNGRPLKEPLHLGWEDLLIAGQCTLCLEKEHPSAAFRVEGDTIVLSRPSSEPSTQTRIGHNETMVGHSPAMIDIRQTVDRVSDSDIPILIFGESGTGKELIAKLIHGHSRRASGPLVIQNAALFSTGLMESELFGHVKGAFTGASRDKVGLVQQADGGSFFLDEIAELPLELQAKLLRLLEDGSYTPVGSTRIQRSNFRIIAATHQDLDRLVREGRFREDLLFRLNALTLELPPLRDRLEDLPGMVEYFLTQYGPKKSFTSKAQKLLKSYSWPGNVRELRNEVMRCCALSGQESIIEVDCLSPKLHEKRPSCSHSVEEHPMAISMVEARDHLEQNMLEEAMEQFGGKKIDVAKALGISRPTLNKKLKEFGLE